MAGPLAGLRRSLGLAAARARRGAAFLRYSRLLERTARLDDEGLRAFQCERLAGLGPIYERVPFQRRRLREAGIGPDGLRGLEDLLAVAPVRKADLLAVDPSELAAVSPDKRG